MTMELYLLSLAYVIGVLSKPSALDASEAMDQKVICHVSLLKVACVSRRRIVDTFVKCIIDIIASEIMPKAIRALSFYCIMSVAMSALMRTSSALGGVKVELISKN